MRTLVILAAMSTCRISAILPDSASDLHLGSLEHSLRPKLFIYRYTNYFRVDSLNEQILAMHWISKRHFYEVWL